MKRLRAFGNLVKDFFLVLQDLCIGSVIKNICVDKEDLCTNLH